MKNLTRMKSRIRSLIGSSARRRLSIAAGASLLTATLGTTPTVSAEASADYVQWLAELDSMLAEREIDTYELQFMPIDFDRIVVTDADGEQRVFHYLSFILRNATISAEDYLDFRASGFRDVMEGFIDRDEVGDLDFAINQGAVFKGANRGLRC